MFTYLCFFFFLEKYFQGLCMLAWWVLQSHSIIIHMSMNCTCFRWMIKKKTSATCRPTRGGGSCSRELIPSRRKWPKNKQRGEPFYIRLFSHPLAFLVFHPPPPRPAFQVGFVHGHVGVGVYREYFCDIFIQCRSDSLDRKCPHRHLVL